MYQYALSQQICKCLKFRALAIMINYVNIPSRDFHLPRNKLPNLRKHINKISVTTVVFPAIHVHNIVQLNKWVFLKSVPNSQLLIGRVK
jgi:hypothetical protein